MGARWVSVPGTNTLYAAFPGTLWDIDAPLPSPRVQGYNNRALAVTRDPARMFQAWPMRTGFVNDPAAPSCGISGVCCPGNAPQSAPWNASWGGTMAQKFIMGQCLDSLSAGVSGAIVQGFLTSNDQYVGETTADSQGMYEFGTPYPATNHYLVAYRAGSPDIAGTTVNTLQGVNRDGT